MNHSSSPNVTEAQESDSKPPPSADAHEQTDQPPPNAGPTNGNLALKPDELEAPLLEGPAVQAQELGPEAKSKHLVAADLDLPVSQRLEAYEDIVDSEVGDTGLTRARNLERLLGLRQVFLKFEGSNPSGTHKDRIAFAQVGDALRRGFECVTAATCGNYGVAVAQAAAMAGLRSQIFIPASDPTRRIPEMERVGAEVIRVTGDYERAIELSKKYAERDDVYDANPGGANTALQLQAYGQIAYEIYDDLRDAPAVVAVPVSNGTTLAGIYRGFLSLYRRGKISRIPKMVAGSAFRKNPIIQAFLKNTERCDDLTIDWIKESVVNEPLASRHSYDGEEALTALRQTGGFAAYASDRSMISYAKMIREQEGYNVLPASTAALIVLLERHRKEPLQGDRYVVVMTGRR